MPTPFVGLLVFKRRVWVAAAGGLAVAFALAPTVFGSRSRVAMNRVDEELEYKKRAQ